MRVLFGQNISGVQTGQDATERCRGISTCPPSHPLFPALQDLFLELADALCILLITLRTELAYPLHEFGGIQLLGHGGNEGKASRRARPPYNKQCASVKPLGVNGDPGSASS